MRIKISTKVEKDFRTVYENFDENLFKKLKPFLTGFKINRYDGCNKGDEVHVEISILGFHQEWKALIVENYQDENEIYFVDEGLQLPKPLKKWRHRHEIAKFIENCIIIDDIRFSTGSMVLDLLIYPALYIQFFLRRSTYKRYFRN